MVDISPAAAAEIERLKANKENFSSLRLIVSSGGCSGLYYDLKFDEVNAAKATIENSSTVGESSSNTSATDDKHGEAKDARDNPLVSPQNIIESHDTENLPANGEDRVFQVKGIDLRVDLQSWKYVEHLKLDYSEDLMGGGFRFYNPQIENVCGCGISFTETK